MQYCWLRSAGGTVEMTKPNSADEPAKQPRRKPVRRELGAVLPNTGEGDSAQAWGDQWSNEERLRAEVPPHFGKI